jgi:hypothetical protein
MSVPVEDTSIVCMKSLVFFDLETTGLPSDHAARITELNFCGVDRSQFIECKTKKLPRVTNRLNLCIDPSRPIDPVATDMSKLDNFNLGQQSKFDENVFNIIVNFLDRYFSNLYLKSTVNQYFNVFFHFKAAKTYLLNCPQWHKIRFPHL